MNTVNDTASVKLEFNDTIGKQSGNERKPVGNTPRRRKHYCNVDARGVHKQAMKGQKYISFKKWQNTSEASNLIQADRGNLP